MLGHKKKIVTVVAINKQKIRVPKTTPTPPHVKHGS
jgi:hypothetical protein